MPLARLTARRAEKYKPLEELRGRAELHRVTLGEWLIERNPFTRALHNLLERR